MCTNLPYAVFVELPREAFRRRRARRVRKMLVEFVDGLLPGGQSGVALSRRVRYVCRGSTRFLFVVDGDRDIAVHAACELWEPPGLDFVAFVLGPDALKDAAASARAIEDRMASAAERPRTVSDGASTIVFVGGTPSDNLRNLLVSRKDGYYGPAARAFVFEDR